MTTETSMNLLRGFERLAPRYIERTRGSQEINERQRSALAHNRATNRFNAAWKDLVYPIICERAEGSRIWDVDGNAYLDYTMGLGCLLFGHKPVFLDEALREQLLAGNHLGAETRLAGEVAELLTDATGHDRFAFVNTGSEAVMTATRLARTVSGRSTVAQFAGAYHGWYDGLIAGRGDVGTVPPGPGMRPGAVADTLVVDYDRRGLETLRGAGDRLAAVLVEPVQSQDIAYQPRELLAELRALADELGFALIFDEMVTGFRLALGGAQEHFGVRADLATYGKVLGGGIPIGAVGGSARFMDAIDGGAWRYGDASTPSAVRTIFAGTFSRNPLAMSAARAVLLHLRGNAAAIYEPLASEATRIAAGLRQALASAPAEYSVKTCGPMIAVEGDSAAAGELLSYHLADRGIFAWVGGIWHLTTASERSDGDTLVAAVNDSIAEMRQVLP